MQGVGQLALVSAPIIACHKRSFVHSHTQRISLADMEWRKSGIKISCRVQVGPALSKKLKSKFAIITSILKTSQSLLCYSAWGLCSKFASLEGFYSVLFVWIKRDPLRLYQKCVLRLQAIADTATCASPAQSVDTITDPELLALWYSIDHWCPDCIPQWNSVPHLLHQMPKGTHFININPGLVDFHRLLLGKAIDPPPTKAIGRGERQLMVIYSPTHTNPNWNLWAIPCKMYMFGKHTGIFCVVQIYNIFGVFFEQCKV